MSDLIHSTAAELGTLIARRDVSSEEVTRAHLDRIEQVDGPVHAFLAVDGERAIESARRVDERIAAGEKLGPLAGVPIAVKDLFCYRGMPTTAASRMLEKWVPPYNSTVVQRCLDAGLVVLGKTNLDEFAMGSSTETSAFGPTHNPWDLDRVPGGSGGGSAAALAAYEAPLALGTDTGGSIRQPAAVTGTVGVKPTYGGTSRHGVIAMASSLDQPGPCARTVLDTALLHEVIGGHDPMDQTSIDQPVPATTEAARIGDVRGMRIGVVRELSGEGYQPGVEARFTETVELLTRLGAEVVEVSCPNFKYALPAYYLIQPAEVSSNLARYDAMRYGLRLDDDGDHSAEQVMRATRGAGFGAEAKRRIILGTCPPDISTPTTVRRRRSAPSSSVTSHRRGAVVTPSWPRRPPLSPSHWGSAPMTRWRCTVQICAPSLRTWPVSRPGRSRAVWPMGCRWVCRSWHRSWPMTASTEWVRLSNTPWRSRGVIPCSPKFPTRPRRTHDDGLCHR